MSDKIQKQQECKNKRQALTQIKRLKLDESLEFRGNNQKLFYEEITKNDITFSIGPAGCGKTYIASYYALTALATKKVDSIIITKPLVELGGEKLGFLPGDIDEKTEPFMMSIYYNMEQIIGKQRLDVLRQTGVIQVIPFAYMRGLPLANKLVILDEAQNATPLQLKAFLTRIGMGSKYVITGDLEQTDIIKENGLEDSIKRFIGLDGVGFSRFTLEDVTRHPIVQGLLSRYKPTWVLPNTSAEITLSRYLA